MAPRVKNKTGHASIGTPHEAVAEGSGADTAMPVGAPLAPVESPCEVLPEMLDGLTEPAREPEPDKGWGLGMVQQAQGAVQGAVFGARAIYSERHASFDIVRDRMDLLGGTPEQRGALAAWLDDHGLPKLREKLQKLWLPSNSQEVVEIEEFPFTLKATPNGSCGYLYMDAAMAARPDFAGAKWSADFPVPELGTGVRIRVNNIGDATVIGYFRKQDYLGLLVAVANQPAFHERNYGTRRIPVMCVFGAEIDLLEAPEAP